MDGIMEVLWLDLKKCNLYEDLAQDGLESRSRIHVANPNIVVDYYYKLGYLDWA